MNSFTVTITSKNQITLPAKIVRSMKLSRGHKLTLTQRNDKMVIEAQASLEERLAPIHEVMAKKMRHTAPISDEEMRQTIVQGVLRRVERSR